MTEVMRPKSKAAAIPILNTITTRDVWQALGLGLRDMTAAPAYSQPFGLAYAAFGWLILFLMFYMGWGVYAYPLATGFALVAPMAAAGLYEISKRLEAKEAVTWSAISSCLFGHKGSAIRIMAVVTTFSYFIWIDIAAALYVAFWGMQTIKFENLVETFIMTPKGLIFMAVGNTVGALLAFTVFSIMAVSLPLLFDREIDFVTAMITSVKSVLKNPIPMLLWCAIIGFLLFLSLASLFVGLLVVFPLLGHSTWHLYRRLVVRE
jgi:uncharacterized membrane protein